MSTNSTISIVRKNGDVVSTYCHSDGYLEYVGKMLFLHYQDSNKIHRLMKPGGISFLDKNIGRKHHFEDFPYFRKHEQCRFYNRDRGEKAKFWPKRYWSLEEFQYEGEHLEYNYIWYRGRWWLLGDDNKLISLYKVLVDRHIIEKIN